MQNVSIFCDFFIALCVNLKYKMAPVKTSHRLQGEEKTSENRCGYRGLILRSIRNQLRVRRTPHIIVFKGLFNIVQRDILDAERTVARVQDHREMSDKGGTNLDYLSDIPIASGAVSNCEGYERPDRSGWAGVSGKIRKLLSQPGGRRPSLL